MTTLSHGMGADPKRIARIESFLSGYRKETITSRVFGLAKRQRMDVLANLIGPVANELDMPFVPVFAEVDSRTDKERAFDAAKLAQFNANAAKMAPAARATAYAKIQAAEGVHRAKTTKHKVSVTLGKVAENFGEDGEFLSFFKVPNQIKDDGTLAEFEIKEEESAYVAVNVLPSGVIGIAKGDPCQIVVGKDLASVPYVSPRAPQLTGIPGLYYYKLGTLRLKANGDMDPEYFLAGMHVLHRVGMNADLTYEGAFSIDGVEITDEAAVFKIRNGIIKGFQEYAAEVIPAGTVDIHLKQS